MDRLGPEIINKKVLENLAKAGALDEFGERNQILTAIDQILKLMASKKKAAESRQIGLFEVGGPLMVSIEPTLELPDVPAADQRQRLAWEKELLGMFLSDHPLKSYRELLASVATPMSTLATEHVDRRVRVAGVIISLKKILTKDKSTMIFGMLEDLSASREFILFPKTLEECGQLFEPDQLLLIEGRVSARDAELKIVVEKAWPLSNELLAQGLPPLNQSPARRGRGGNGGGNWTNNKQYETRPQARPRTGPAKTYGLAVELPASATQETLQKMKVILEQYPGQTPVVLRMSTANGTQEIHAKSLIDLAKPVEADLGMLVGRQNVVLFELEAPAPN